MRVLEIMETDVCESLLPTAQVQEACSNHDEAREVERELLDAAATGVNGDDAGDRRFTATTGENGDEEEISR